MPHLIVKTIAKWHHDFTQRDKLKPKAFVDSYAFDLGYHSAYGLSVFAIALQFAVLVPYVSLFACVFFAFKYSVDKYNLSFVYNSEFRARGEIFKRVVYLSLVNLVLIQVIMIGFFAINLPHTNLVLWTGIGLVAVELVAIFIVFKKVEDRQKQQHFEERTKSKW